MSESTKNPNNCEGCDYKHMEKHGGHCYMFRDEPDEVCYQHTARKAELPVGAMRTLMGLIMGVPGTANTLDLTVFQNKDDPNDLSVAMEVKPKQ